MNYSNTAKEIVQQIGGKENVSHLEHCSTRLRFTLKDNSKVNEKQLGEVDGVIGVRQNYQCQVIIGNEVVEVFDEVKKIIGDQFVSEEDEAKQKKKWGSVLLDFIISVFQPLVPAIAGGGILQSILLLLSVTGVMDKTTSTYQVLSLVGSAPIYFIPILVAITTANKLKVNPLVAVSAVGALLLPGMVQLLGKGATFFSFGIENISYASQVFPAILTVLLYSVCEKWFTKISPKSIRIFFVPMVSLLITVPVSLLVLGPIGFNIGSMLSTVILYLHSHFGWVAMGLLAGILPIMVATGMHKALVPYAVATMGKMGNEALYLPASLAHNLSESGACFAVSIKSKDKRLKSTALSAGISALFGITEPALYGVTIIHKKVLYSVIFSSVIGGSFAGLMALKSFALVGPGLASITMFIDPSNSKNILWAFVTLGISFVISFITAFVLYSDKGEFRNKKKETKLVDLNSPVLGKVIALEEVNDDVFSTGMVGEGLAFEPKEGIVYAPYSGEVTMLFNTNHAIGMKTSEGTEILIHIGLDTVNMAGRGFSSFVKQGEMIVQGQKLIEFDIEKIKQEGFDPIVIMIVTNKSDYQFTKFEENESVTIDKTVLELEVI